METYQIKAVILNRQPFRENDLKVTLYSPEAGKQSLVARGARKFKAKAAAHLEPICLSQVMVVRGKQYDYVGSAIAQQCFMNIKDDLDKLSASGQAIRIFNKSIKENQADEEIFNLLIGYLDFLETGNLKSDPDLLAAYFIFKLQALLGFEPQLHHCLACQKPILPGNNRIDFTGGGLLCPNCSINSNQLTISDDCIKLLRLILKENFVVLNKIKVSNDLKIEAQKHIEGFLDHHGR